MALAEEDGGAVVEGGSKRFGCEGEEGLDVAGWWEERFRRE